MLRGCCAALSEAVLDTIDEQLPSWDTLVLLQPVAPLPCSAIQIEQGLLDLEVLWGGVGPEELLPLVQPRDRVVGAVVLRETQLVGRRRKLFARVGGTGVIEQPFFSKIWVWTFLADAERRPVS